MDHFIKKNLPISKFSLFFVVLFLFFLGAGWLPCQRGGGEGWFSFFFRNFRSLKKGGVDPKRFV